MIQLTPTQTGLAMVTPYNAGFVAEFKATIPVTLRRWDYDNKRWLIDPSVAHHVADLCMKHFGRRPEIPAANHTPKPQQRILEVRYIGVTKDRGGDERSAFGYVNGSWSVLFPERTLLAWFGAPVTPGEHTTLFGVLGVPRDADAVAIKTAYRRLAKQWHPDVCREPNAAEMFKRINEAYQILSDDTKRRKYLAGLALEASLSNQRRAVATERGYRSPLRCGLILAEGVDRLGVFEVHQILVWEDIVDSHGRVLVTSWPAGADMFEEVWQ